MPSAVIDRSSPVPLWAQVLADLQRRIRAGEFDERFPTDHELISQYDVSRHTVREAVRRLVDDGVLRRERGRGTFVVRPLVAQPVGAIYSLFRSVESQGMTQRSRVLDLREVVEPEVAARLGVDPETLLVRLERVRLADDSPLAHDTAWLPATVARPLLDADFTRTALYDELERRCGVRPEAGTEWVHVALPDPTEQRLLDIGRHQPVWVIERHTTAGGRPLEWRRTVVRGDRYALVARWSEGSPYETSMAPTGTAHRG